VVTVRIVHETTTAVKAGAGAKFAITAAPTNKV
jgi:hypothetical protein